MIKVKEKFHHALAGSRCICIYEIHHDMYTCCSRQDPTITHGFSNDGGCVQSIYYRERGVDEREIDIGRER